MKKILLLLGLILGISGALLLSSPQNVQANNSTVIYYLLSNMSQTFQMTNDQGQSVTITVSPDTSTINDPNEPSLLASRNYITSKQGYGWSLSYKIRVTHNQINGIYDLKSSAYIGSLVVSDLSKVSNVEARWTEKHRLSLITTTFSCTARIQNKKLLMS